MTLVQITNYTSPNCTDRSQVNVHCIEHFFTVHEFWTTCACPGKTELPWKFSLYWINFSHSGFLTTCACPENRVSPEIWIYIYIYFFIFYFFIECIFYHSGFFSHFVLSLKNRGCPEFTVLIVYFLSFWIFEQLTLALKNRRLPEFTVRNVYFLLFRSFE